MKNLEMKGLTKQNQVRKSNKQILILKLFWHSNNKNDNKKDKSRKNMNTSCDRFWQK